VNLVAQGSGFCAVKTGISLFTYGKASAKDKPNQETGIHLHAASGKLSSQSQDDATRLTADKTITVASVTKGVSVTAKQYVMLTAQGAFLKLEGGNIMVHGPGKIEFKASMKELTGPQSTASSTQPPLKGSIQGCAQATSDASAQQAGAQVL
jgi:type VI secretion system secreted protein VgrG